MTLNNFDLAFVWRLKNAASMSNFFTVRLDAVYYYLILFVKVIVYCGSFLVNDFNTLDDADACIDVRVVSGSIFDGTTN